MRGPGAPPVLVEVIRDGHVESAHRGHLVLADAEGAVAVALGDAEHLLYPRSAVKPFQAMGSLDLIDRVGVDLGPDGLAIVCASHDGSSTHQVEVARLLALAGLDEAALACPASLPWDRATLLDQRVATPLAHNCSGKHAGFLLGTRAVGADVRAYLLPDAPVQRAARDRLCEAAGARLHRHGIDGCGAPAWILRLRDLATAFARLASGQGPYRRVRDAMRRRPDLIGGPGRTDTRLMLGDHQVVAKAGAEAVLAVGIEDQWYGPLGLVVKIEDGSARATGPVVAAGLSALGRRVDEDLIRPAVLGGGVPHGRLEPAPEIFAAISAIVHGEDAASALRAGQGDQRTGSSCSAGEAFPSGH